jgi:hypothetical protein
MLPPNGGERIVCSHKTTRRLTTYQELLIRVVFFLSYYMIDQFAAHYYIAKSYGLEREFVDTYRFFRKQKVSRAFAAYYAAKEWDL